MKAFCITNNIKGKQGTLDVDWLAYYNHAINMENGLPVSGGALVWRPGGDREGDKARERLHYLMLNSCKKDHDTETREAISATKQRRATGAMDAPLEDCTDAEGLNVAVGTIPSITIRMYLMDPSAYESNF